jgi:hypothetical protein
MDISPARIMTVPLLLLALLGVYAGIITFQQDLAFTAAQTEISFWGRDNYQPELKTIKHAGHTIDTLLQQAPLHPEYLGLSAKYEAWQAYWTSEPDERVSFNQGAVQSQYKAMLSRPAHRQGWSMMLDYASRTGDGEAMLSKAQARLQALAFSGK